MFGIFSKLTLPGLVTGGAMAAKNEIAPSAPGYSQIPMGTPTPMGSGIDPHQLQALMGSYNTFLQNLGAPSLMRSPSIGTQAPSIGTQGPARFNPIRPGFDPGTLVALGSLSPWRFGPYGGAGAYGGGFGGAAPRPVRQ